MNASTLPPLRSWLADRDRDYLTALLTYRPDAIAPPPRDAAALAARLTLHDSARRVLPQLDAPALAVLEACVDTGGDMHAVAASAVIDDVLDRLAEADVPVKHRPTPARLRTALDELRNRALIYGDGPTKTGSFSGRARKTDPNPHADLLMVAPGAWEALPAGWTVLPAADQPTTAELKEALGAIDERQHRVLQTLADAGGLGTTRDAAPDADPQRPVPRLIEAELLQRIDPKTVRLPDRVRALMHGARLPEGPVALKPDSTDAPDIAGADDRGATTALELLYAMARLLEFLGTTPVPLRRDGLLSVRGQRRLADEMGADYERLLRFAQCAHLIACGEPDPAPADDSGGDYLAPTDTADEFLAATGPGRWAILIEAVLTADPPAPLLPDQPPQPSPALRTALADVALGSGGLPDATAGLLHYRPLIAMRTPAAVLDTALTDLEALGLIVCQDPGFAVTAAWRACAHGVDPDGLTGLLPPPARQFIAQADLTILVPGPPEPELARTLAMFSVVESPGVASVHRVTEESLQRALDAGLSASELHEFLRTRSMGEVPQGLSQLIDDVSRRHGRVRGGPAASYLRCSDPVELAAIETSPAAEILGLRRIADTVLISQAPLSRVIDILREYGHTAVAEDAAGAAISFAPRPCRVHPTAPRPPAHPAADAGLVSVAVDAVLSAGTEGTRIGVRDDPATGAAAHDVLARAARNGLLVTLGFVDRNGRAGRTTVRPVTVNGGQVDGIDPATGEVRRFLMHRVTEVVVEDA
ncbi:helicase-associated domain-containing protein [Corynebacterium sp. TAE3-ERU12]|uniref:helicase-associated domain-containing protein n=1 Tax=Corynebacterium sp. TAE3-ERU12 TaxID=2849491 RepID=UPI001C44673E|nr:helicase-associated domain-containing protein [Corynebacterium sp. TAE3-ERU12]MBV7295538.1 helicase-associated domain-containing protein [Corynebacterium sp. TAE3-ERU12]